MCKPLVMQILHMAFIKPSYTYIEEIARTKSSISSAILTVLQQQQQQHNLETTTSAAAITQAVVATRSVQQQQQQHFQAKLTQGLKHTAPSSASPRTIWT